MDNLIEAACARGLRLAGEEDELLHGRFQDVTLAPPPHRGTLPFNS